MFICSALSRSDRISFTPARAPHSIVRACGRVRFCSQASFISLCCMASWFSIALACSLIALSGCAARAGLPSYSTVPQFTLTDQNGGSFDSTRLNGKVWIADFIYTTCPGPCPRMSSQMHQVQKALPGIDLVSFTIDPKTDTPAVLKEYAGHFEAADRWHFLTGPEATLQHLCKDVFMLG